MAGFQAAFAAKKGFEKCLLPVQSTVTSRTIKCSDDFTLLQKIGQLKPTHFFLVITMLKEDPTCEKSCNLSVPASYCH